VCQARKATHITTARRPHDQRARHKFCALHLLHASLSQSHHGTYYTHADAVDAVGTCCGACVLPSAVAMLRSCVGLVLLMGLRCVHMHAQTTPARSQRGRWTVLSLGGQSTPLPDATSLCWVEQQHSLWGEQPHSLWGEQPHSLWVEQQHSLWGEQPHSLWGEQPHSLWGEQQHSLWVEQQHSLWGEQPHSLWVSSALSVG
jgi:hypothetical protein